MSEPPPVGAGRVGSSLQGGQTHRRDPEGVETATIASVVSLEGKRVLEVGCGTGRLTAFAAQHAAFVYAFDPSGDSIAVDTQPLSAELVETVSNWGGTCAPSELARQLAAAGPAQLHQDVRLRVLRAL